MNIKFLVGSASAIFAALISTSSLAEVREGGDYRIEWEASPSTSVYEEYKTDIFRIGWGNSGGNITGSYSLLATADANPSRQLLGQLYAQSDFYISAPEDIELRFSFWHLQASTVILDKSSGREIFSGSISRYGNKSENFRLSFSANEQPLIPELSISTTYTFTPGNFLTPSYDSTCAALECMVFGADSARVSTGFSVSTAQVPEPSSAVLLSFGAFVLAGAFLRRRAGQ